MANSGAGKLWIPRFRGQDRSFEEAGMETVGLGFCFEDLPVGRQFKTIGRTVTEADITNFVNCTGMVEVLFTNLEFLAHESDIKQRLAPAALVYAFAEGLSGAVDHAAHRLCLSAHGAQCREPGLQPG
jgi:acyl dehydratase